MKQTMHDRFLAADKRRKLERDVMVKAAQERVKAEHFLEEANRKLLQAERMLDSAQLVREGWTRATYDDGWWRAVPETWQHTSGFEVTRTLGSTGIFWAMQWVPAPTPASETTRGSVYSVGSGSGSIYVRYPPNPAPMTYHTSLEAALEWWRLATINLGRYPELPPKGLFDRLRKS